MSTGGRRRRIRPGQNRRRVAHVPDITAFLPEGPVILFDARVRLWGINEAARQWLVAAGKDSDLPEKVRQFRESGKHGGFLGIGPLEAHITVLGSGKRRRYLVHLPPQLELTPAERLLSAAQIQVARRAAAGATLAEIAQAMQRSIETVRAQLREVYRKLEVSRRVELARVLVAKRSAGG
jgi:DNA-binding CsgD family transcriptional regulator